MAEGVLGKVSKLYPDGTRAVSDLDLAIDDGARRGMETAASKGRQRGSADRWLSLEQAQRHLATSAGTCSRHDPRRPVGGHQEGHGRKIRK